MKLKWKIAQQFELRWWKNYLRGKSKEEYTAWKKNYWKALLSTISDTILIDSTKTICDLGCGPAGVFMVFAENKVTAVDPLIDEYENLNLFFRKEDYLHTTFVQSSMEEFVTTEKFDFVFCMNAVNHVRDIEKGFDTLKEVCSSNGFVIVSIDAHNYSFFKYLFRLVPADVLHPHQYNLTEYKLFFEKRGLKILKTELLKKEFFFNHYLLIAK